MEPTLTPPDPDHDPLDLLLRAAPPPIADDGFTERVCAALPRRTHDLSSPLRKLVLASSICLGSALTWWCGSQLNPEWTSSIADALLAWKLEPWHALLIAILFAVWGMAGWDRATEDGS